MKTIVRRTAIIIAAGALGFGGLGAAAPAFAGGDPFSGPGAISTEGPGGNGRGGHSDRGDGSGLGRGSGCPSPAITAGQGTPNAAQKSALASMAQEEKLAYDLYTAFADRYDAVVFDHIAASESRHLAAVRVLLQRYGITDPTAGRAAGSFADATTQAAFDELLKQGQGSLSAALAVGRQVERDDIAGLEAARDGLAAADIDQVYTRLLAASQRHLTAFTRWTTR